MGSGFVGSLDFISEKMKDLRGKSFSSEKGIALRFQIGGFLGAMDPILTPRLKRIVSSLFTETFRSPWRIDNIVER